MDFGDSTEGFGSHLEQLLQVFVSVKARAVHVVGILLLFTHFHEFLISRELFLFTVVALVANLN